MSVSKVLDKFIQKQINAGNDDYAFRLAEYSDKHFDDEGQRYSYPDMDEYSAPRTIQDRFYEWLQDDHGNLHQDDDRDLLWQQFLEQQETDQMEEDSNEMSYWRGQYDADKRNRVEPMPREDMPDKMRMREDLGLSNASANLKKVMAKYINYDLIQKDSEEKGKTQWEDSRKSWNDKMDKELGCKERTSRRNSELEPTEAEKRKENTTIKESDTTERRLARWADWKKKNTRTASKDIWVQALNIVDQGVALCPKDKSSLVLDKKAFTAKCTRCAYKAPIDRIATDVMTNQIKESNNLKNMISKYANLSAFDRPYQDIFNGRVQNNWEDMLGRWNKYLGPDYGVSRAPKKNPCIADEFVNEPVAVASKNLKQMLKKYAQQEQWGDWDTQVHPEEDPRADEYEAELQSVRAVEDLYKQYAHHYQSEDLKRAFKEGVQIGARGY